MADCEMCGTSSKLTKIKVENNLTMNVCSNCSKFGTALRETKGKQFANKSFGHQKRNSESDEESFIIQNYGKLIKSARESRNLEPETFAKQLNEKESILLKIESGNYKPGFPLAKKLERFLNIQLIKKRSRSKLKENYDESRNKNDSNISSNLTFGDILKKAMKK
ncbi:MAG: multiprotein bridging factor aMBF1 [Patescibacteria group bacterium]|nr:multiprotein bridging factor aMBF1 [Patescibacteria group bacterium]